MILDAKDLVAGRLASFAAKKALLGEKIDIINSEKAVITGNKKQVLEKFRQRFHRGVPLKGPYIIRSPERLLRRMIRGMLPYKQEKGKLAFSRVKCYKSIPTQFEGKDFVTIEKANVEKVPNLKYITIERISRYLKDKD